MSASPPSSSAPSSPAPSSQGSEPVCLGAFAGAHGVKGLVKVKSFTEDPDAIAAYGPLRDETGERVFRLALKGRAKGPLLAAVDGVGDRDAAEALKGTRLYVERAALPATEDEETYYHVDLIGLQVQDDGGERLGEVKAVNNHGAGDFLEIVRPDGPDLLIPFTKAAVPKVDLAGNVLMISRAALVE